MSPKVLFALVMCFAISACATKQISTAKAVPVPPERIFIAPATGDIYSVRINRDAGFAGSGCMARIYLDGKDAADLEPGEAVVLSLATGRHIIGASPSPASGKMCSAFDAAARHRRETEVTGVTGETRNYRFSISATGDISLAPTAF